MATKCPICGRYLRQKGSTYYCTKCKDYYFETVLPFSTDSADEVKIRVELNKTIKELGVEKIEK